MSMCNCVYVIESTEKLLYAGANLLHCLWSIIPANITVIIMAPYGIGQAIIFLPCGFFFYLLFIYHFSSPNLGRRGLDVCHTWPHGVALVQI